ncbi:hypothetical protein [Photobacterium sp. 53610]|uniref:hypothetical protein n=1 Tax=Photobacterium sp. 53610 TaxID=3102789 RepID=UPI002ED8E817
MSYSKDKTLTMLGLSEICIADDCGIITLNRDTSSRTIGVDCQKDNVGVIIIGL